MTNSESRKNYFSHEWVSYIADWETGEKVVACGNCGCEDKGDPLEFDWLEYPPCS